MKKLIRENRGELIQLIRENRGELILSSVIILLPVLIGLLAWNALPRRMPVHWNLQGEADGYGGRLFALLVTPLLLLGIHWLIVVLVGAFGNGVAGSKAVKVIFWEMPLLSVLVSGQVLTSAMGIDFSFVSLLMPAMGVLFVILGNYFPKITQNRVMGIRVKWTLESEENWNATHRFGGKVWVAGGILMIITSLVSPIVLPLLVLLVMAVVPILYSWRYARTHGETGEKAQTAARSRAGRAVTVILIAAVTLGIVFLVTSGDISQEYGEDSFTIHAPYWDDLTVDYEAIKRVEYRESLEAGSRTWGFGSFRLLLGEFENEEFGTYTRYTYTGDGPCVVITGEGGTLVLGGKDEESTREIYETLLEKTGMEGGES